MSPSSMSPAERARKGVGLVLQQMQPAGKATAMAAAMGMSDAAVSRIKNERLEEVVLFLAHAGIKLVPCEFVCVNAESYQAMTHIASKAMANPGIARQLIWEPD